MGAELERIERIRRFTVAIAALLLSAATASAQPAAEVAFERGREMLQVGKYVEACNAFEESQRLRPQPDTQFNIALCSEQLGKLATALALHQELAQTLDTPARRAKSLDLAAQLEPRVPRLKLLVGEARKRTRRPPPELEVRVNGFRITNFDGLPIDLGKTRVTAIAPGFLEWSGQINAKAEAKVVTQTIDLERDPDARLGVEPAEPDPAPAEAPRVDQPASSDRKTYAAITIAMGGLAIGGGVVFGVLARSAWNDALAACGGDSACNETEHPVAAPIRDMAISRGNLSTVMFVAGGVAVAAGLVLYVTAPAERKTVAIAPSVDASSAGVIVFGRF